MFLLFLLLDSLHSTGADPGISKRGRDPGAVGFLVGHLNCGTANLSPQSFTIWGSQAPEVINFSHVTKKYMPLKGGSNTGVPGARPPVLICKF